MIPLSPPVIRLILAGTLIVGGVVLSMVRSRQSAKPDTPDRERSVVKVYNNLAKETKPEADDKANETKPAADDKAKEADDKAKEGKK